MEEKGNKWKRKKKAEKKKNKCRILETIKN